jgi:hypothetical protein
MDAGDTERKPRPLLCYQARQRLPNIPVSNQRNMQTAIVTGPL